jgi:hypothetical protein
MAESEFNVILGASLILGGGHIRDGFQSPDRNDGMSDRVVCLGSLKNEPLPEI